MAQLSDFISRIFSTDRTQGLSGGAEVVIDQDPASAFYAARLRKHRTDEDLVANPEFLWATASFQGRKGGLRAHVHAERGDGVASFTDALVVVNQADWERARLSTLGDPWLDRATTSLTERFVQYCAREKFELLYGTRPLRFRFLADGGQEMLGQSFNLGPGEYITGLLPNVYVGPAARSRAVLAVHLNLPGVWEGYREVGRLYSDQILFTLGRHWLDNFHHPALREPGLYRLQQYPDGSLVHVISPELQDRYLVRSDAVDGGASVLTVAEWNGNAVAYLVLAVVESMTVDFSSRPDIDLPEPPPRVEAPVQAVVDEIPTGDGVAPRPEPAAPLAIGLAGGSLAASEMQARAPSSVPSGFQNRAMLSKTIVPGAIESRILTLHERGALLQKVHFSNFMDGYDVYIGPGGRVGTQMSEPKATLQVRGGRVSLKVDDPAVRVDDRAVPAGKAVPLRGQVTIEVDGNRLTYKDLTDVRAEGWPYLGELRRPGAGSYLEFGQAHRVGRDRRCKVRLPDEPHNENIAWLPSVGGGTTIRSRTGDIPKSRFYTDSIMVASEHAEVDLRGEPVLRSLARHCYTFVRRGPEVVALFPREGAGGRQEFELQANDEVLVGNCLFQVAFPPPGGAGAQASSAPEIPRLTPADLAAQVDDVPLGISRATVEPPPAAGFGERGAPPRAVRLDPPAAPRAEPPRDEPPRAEPPPAEPARPAPDAGKPPPPMMLGTMSFYMDPPRVLTETTNEEPPTPTEPKLPTPPAVEITYDPSEPVLAVEEAQWKFEISRPAQLVLGGWMVSGEVTVGNHRGCAVVVPEVRAFKEQAFMTLEYFRLFVRGKKGKVELLQPGEATLRAGDAETTLCEDLDRAALSIVRRDANLEPDFDVQLALQADPSLPDPRSRLLTVDTSDRLVAALFTTGCPLRSPRKVQLGPIAASVVYDGQRLIVSDYLDSYRQSAGYRPFFLREGGRPWRTAPEDGAPFMLGPGDSLIAGMAIYRFQVA